MAKEPACQPPLGVDDDHGQAQSRRFDERALDKGTYFGCAAVGALDCAWISIPVNTSAAGATGGLAVQAGSTDYSVPDGVSRIRFTTYFDRPVSMALTSPDGITYGPVGAGPVAGYSAGEEYEIYEIKDPAGGDWRLSFSFAEEQPSTLLLGTTIMDVEAATENRPPTARTSVPPHIPVGQAAEFSGIQSYDADGVIIKYEWDFEDDGEFEFESGQPVASHTYHSIGTTRAALRVTDDRGGQDTVYFAVRVGDFSFLPSLAAP
jgi:hypothetical protein